MSIIVTLISCAIQAEKCYSCDFEEFFVEDNGWLNVSICALVSFTLYGFIFWEAAKTLVVMISIIALIIATVIHYAKTKSYDLENFLYDNHGFLTMSIVMLLGTSVFDFAFSGFFYGLTVTLALVLNIVLGVISKCLINEVYFVAYFGARNGALYSYLPLLVGGLLTGIIWSSWWMLIISTVLYLIVYTISVSGIWYGVKSTGSSPSG